DSECRLQRQRSLRDDQPGQAEAGTLSAHGRRGNRGSQRSREPERLHGHRDVSSGRPRADPARTPARGCSRRAGRMGSMQDLLATAIEMHQAGQLGPAAQLYQKVLAKEATNAAALHLLGVLHHQRGEHARAVELIAQAVALRPNVPAFHANLAEAYRALGQLERAVGCCRAALQLWPEYPEALCNLGVALHGLGRAAEAVDPLRRALELKPDFA